MTTNSRPGVQQGEGSNPGRATAAKGAEAPTPSVERISPARKSRAVCVRLSPAEYRVVERIATQRAMTIPDVLRAGIDHLTIKETS